MSGFTCNVHGIPITVVLPDDLPSGRVFPSLEALPRASDAGGGWRIEVGDWEDAADDGRVAALPVRKVRLWPDIDVRLKHAGDGILHAGVDGAAAWLDANRRRVDFRFLPAAEAVAEKLGRVVVTEIMRYEGRFVMHAAALEVSGGCVLICGASGSGKSTLATVWACIGDARFMAEDRCVVFRRADCLWAGGIADSLWLAPETEALLEGLSIRLPASQGEFEGKRAYNCHDLLLWLCDQPRPVKALLFLAELSPGADVRPCASEEAFRLLHEGSFQHGEVGVMQAHFETLADLSSDVPAYLVRRRLDCRTAVANLDALVAKIPARVHPVSPSSPQHSLRGSKDDIARADERLRSILARPPGSAPAGSYTEEEWFEIFRAANRAGVTARLALSLDGGGLPASCRNPLPNALRVARRLAREA